MPSVQLSSSFVETMHAFRQRSFHSRLLVVISTHQTELLGNKVIAVLKPCLSWNAVYTGISLQCFRSALSIHAYLSINHAIIFYACI